MFGSILAALTCIAWHPIYTGTSVVVRASSETAPDGSPAFEALRPDGRPTSVWCRGDEMVPIRPGGTYEVSCWLKGEGGTGVSLGVECAWDAATKKHWYCTPGFRLADRWVRRTTRFTVPAATAHPLLVQGLTTPAISVAKPAVAKRLLFAGWTLREVEPVCLAPRGTRESLVPPDSGRPLPPPSPMFRPAGPGNRVFDASFELPLPRHVSPGADDEPVPMWVSDETTAVHGRRSLRMDARTSGLAGWWGSAGFFPANSNVVFSISLKADRPCEAELSLGAVTHDWLTDKPSWRGCPVTKVRLTTVWKRFSTVGFVGKTDPFLQPRVKVATNAVVWLDAAQCEAGHVPTPFGVMDPVESRISLKEFVIESDGQPGRRETATLDIVRHGTDGSVRTETRQIDFDISRFGVFALTNRVDGYWSMPAQYAVVHPIPVAPPSKGVVFGVNPGIPHTRGGRGKNRAFGPDAAGLDEYFRFLRLSGSRLARLMDMAEWASLNPRPGVFRFDRLDRLLRHGEAAGVKLMPVLGGSMFLDNKEEHHNGGMNKWFVRKNARTVDVKPPYWAKRLLMPREEDWRVFVRAVAEHFRGRIPYYEIVNEPNLQVPVAADYVSLLKSAFEEIRAADPSAKVVGICSTGDFGADAGKFIREVGEAGAFEHLDIMSFHPYCAATDKTPVTADELLAQVRALADKYRPGCPILESELFYICDQTALGSDCARKDRWPAGDLVRRLVADASAGCVASTPLAGSQLAMPSPENAFLNFSVDYNEPRLVPSDRFAVQNACAWFLEGAEPLTKPTTKSGLNAYRFRSRTGSEVTVMWAIEADGAREIARPADVAAYDLYGNPLVSDRIRIGTEPVYLVKQ